MRCKREGNFFDNRIQIRYTSKQYSIICVPGILEMRRRRDILFFTETQMRKKAACYAL